MSPGHWAVHICHYKPSRPLPPTVYALLLIKRMDELVFFDSEIIWVKPSESSRAFVFVARAYSTRKPHGLPSQNISRVPAPSPAHSCRRPRPAAPGSARCLQRRPDRSSPTPGSLPRPRARTVTATSQRGTLRDEEADPASAALPSAHEAEARAPARVPSSARSRAPDLSPCRCVPASFRCSPAGLRAPSGRRPPCFCWPHAPPR